MESCLLRAPRSSKTFEKESAGPGDGRGPFWKVQAWPALLHLTFAHSGVLDGTSSEQPWVGLNLECPWWLMEHLS